MHHLGGTYRRIHKTRKGTHTTARVELFFLKSSVLPCGNKTLSKSELVIPAFECQRQQAFRLHTAQILVHLVNNLYTLFELFCCTWFNVRFRPLTTLLAVTVAVVLQTLALPEIWGCHNHTDGM
jgi:hypothetical protein